jgi:hypothetical protein
MRGYQEPASHMQHDAFVTLSVLRENWVGASAGHCCGARKLGVRMLCAAWRPPRRCLMSGRCALPWRKASPQNHAARYAVIAGCVADPSDWRSRGAKGLYAGSSR